MKSTKPRISVIIGVYNCADTLPEALDSLMAQTMDDFQIVVCDDGSTDNTIDIINDYSRRYRDKFIVLSNETNMGLNHTLNRCIEVADTELIARMDGDDISLPDRFKVQVEYLDAHPEIDFVSGMVKRFDENGFFVSSQQKALVEPTPADYARGRAFVHAATIFRRSCLTAINGYGVSRKLLRVEDFDLWLRLYKAGYRGNNIDKIIYHIRDDHNALKRRSFITRHNESRVIAKCIRMFDLPASYYIYTVLPYIKYIMPRFIYNYFHRQSRSVLGKS